MSKSGKKKSISSWKLELLLLLNILRAVQTVNLIILLLIEVIYKIVLLLFLFMKAYSFR